MRVIYRPKSLVLGLGCDKGIAPELLERGVDTLLERNGLSAKSVKEIATIVVKQTSCWCLRRSGAAANLLRRKSLTPGRASRILLRLSATTLSAWGGRACCVVGRGGFEAAGPETDLYGTGSGAIDDAGCGSHSIFAEAYL